MKKPNKTSLNQIKVKVKHPIEQLPIEAVTYGHTVGNKLEVVTRNQRVLYDKLQAIENLLGKIFHSITI